MISNILLSKNLTDSKKLCLQRLQDVHKRRQREKVPLQAEMKVDCTKQGQKTTLNNVTFWAFLAASLAFAFSLAALKLARQHASITQIPELYYKCIFSPGPCMRTYNTIKKLTAVLFEHSRC